jgi:hypothetical protein
MTKLKKTKLSFAFSLLVLFLTASLFWNCEAEREFMHNNTKNNNEITFEQFKNETGLVNFKTKIKVNTTISNSLLRTTNGSYELSDFNISTDIIKKLETYNIKSYTFRIFPKVATIETEKSIFNLTLVRINGIWKATIIEFKPNESNLERIRQGLTEKIEGKVAVLYDGTYENNNFQVNTDGCVLVTITVMTCVGCTGECDANDAEGCPQGICSIDTSSFFWCADLGDSGGGFFGVAPGDSGGTMPGGGIGNGDTDIFYDNTNPANEDPRPILVNTKDTSIEGILIDEDDILPCEQLANISDPTKINVAEQIEWLTEKINDPNNKTEHGFTTDKRLNADGETYNYENIQVSSPYETSIDFQPDDYRIGAGHMHPPVKGIPMYSFGDVNVLLDFYDGASPTRKDEVFHVLVVKNKQTNLIETYCILIDNITTFRNAINSKLNNPVNQSLNLEAKIKEQHDLQKILYKNKNQNQLEISFLQQFSNFGISLYKADTNLKWSKLELENNNGSGLQTVPTPCN